MGKVRGSLMFIFAMLFIAACVDEEDGAATDIDAEKLSQSSKDDPMEAYAVESAGWCRYDCMWGETSCRSRGGTVVEGNCFWRRVCCDLSGDNDTEDTDTNEGNHDTGGDHCLNDVTITDYDDDGPFSTRRETSGRVKMWVPRVPSGCKVPVISFANGTGASCSMYGAYLERLATHGFLSVCYENTNTGAGDYGITAIETAFREYPNMVDYRIGATGHSQGGQASFIIHAKAEEKWGSQSPAMASLAIEPASGFGDQPSGGRWQQWYEKIRTPIFMFAGEGTDGLVSESWVRSAYRATSDDVEAYFWVADGATHIPVPNALSSEVGVPWFRWQLLGDQDACRAFHSLLNGRTWSERYSKNETPCN